MNTEDLFLLRKQQLIGKFWCNFSVLESTLRAHIGTMLHEKLTGLNAAKGETIPCNAMTNYDSFPKLCNKYSELFNSSINFSNIEKTRDAFAHGRLFFDSESSEYVLIKYSAPKNNNVEVVFREVIDLHKLELLNNEINDKILEVIQEVEDASN
ncbi:hypothetical protein PQI64_14815 [Shewanella bicestrii]